MEIKLLCTSTVSLYGILATTSKTNYTEDKQNKLLLYILRLRENIVINYKLFINSYKLCSLKRSI